MKTLAFLKWPILLLFSGVIMFRLGAFFRARQITISVPFIVCGYMMILAAIIWIILKISFLKNPENDGD